MIERAGHLEELSHTFEQEKTAESMGGISLLVVVCVSYLIVINLIIDLPNHYS